MLQGYLAKTWQTALTKCGVKRDKASNTMTYLFKQIWNTLFQQLWDTRNHILHNTPNCYRTAESNNLDSKLLWYSENRYRLFTHGDADLAGFDREKIEHMGRKLKRKCVQHLDRLHKVFTLESKNLKEGQRTLTNIQRTRRPPNQRSKARAKSRRQQRDQLAMARRKSKQSRLQVTITKRVPTTIQDREEQRIKDRNKKFSDKKEKKKIIQGKIQKYLQGARSRRGATRPPEGIHPD